MRPTVRPATASPAPASRPGVPDCFLAMASGTTHGLFIEFKTDSGRLFAHQRVLIEALRQSGFRVEVIYTLAYFQTLLTEYLAA